MADDLVVSKVHEIMHELLDMSCAMRAMVKIW